MTEVTTVTYTLKSPIEFQGNAYKTLTFREAETGDLMIAARYPDETSKSICILSCMADIPLPAFQKIKLAELNKIMSETSSLLGESTPDMTGV
ncbi:phage tail assembly protein [Rhizobium tumorigenes]|uniref:phage tail assembly protein n=1 Tax=Rhizobium tumorigenes TaxID=2041385 RepID=UPI00241D11B5|nr:phage tail assembly protein [Rhizobium tumorigenes]WFS02764.1 phage tail assembly protein [Rhizobium tumorigenes]